MILISVIGDFYSSVLPIFYEFKDEISVHIIIHDDYKNDTLSAQKIINGTLAYIKKNQLDIDSFVIKIDEDSLEAIKRVTTLVAKHTDTYEKLYINITDGLANVGVLLSDAFKAKGANIITYDRYDNEYNILTSISMKTYKMQTSISIKEHLLLKNIEVVSVENRDFAQKHENSLNLFFEKYEADRKLYKKDTHYNKALDTKATGFLYEYYIYNLIKEFNVDDILLGVKVKDNRLDDIYLENEYDILIMKNNHLHMIECKYLKVLDTTALLYKLDSVKETLDEDANVMIVTDSDTYDKTADIPNVEISQMYKRAFAKKISLRGSPTTCVKTFMQDVNTYFALETKNIDALYAKKRTYTSIKKQSRERMKVEIEAFLTKTFALHVDFFDAKEIAKILQHKNNMQLPFQAREAMNKENIKELIKRINKMLLSTQEYISIEDVYQFYSSHCLRARNMILLLSHTLQDEQVQAAESMYGVDNFIFMPKCLQDIWANVPADTESIAKIVQKFTLFLQENSKKDDIVLVQGDAGMTYSLINFCKKTGRIAVYATTKRISKEYKEENHSVKKSIFKFERFREYE